MNSPYLGRGTSHPITVHKKGNMIDRLADSCPACLMIPRMWSAFQNLMNIGTLSNALVNTRQDLWLAESVIPPRREKCSSQAGLPVSLQPCTETLACEDGVLLTCPIRAERPRHNVTIHITTHMLNKVFLVLQWQLIVLVYCHTENTEKA